MNHRIHVFPLVLVAMLLLTIPKPARANLRVSSVIGDHMVLQRNASARIWGWAEPGQVVNVSATWRAAPWAAKADASGRWQADVETPDASAEPMRLAILAGEEKIEINDVLIGEVWFCSGQSNMGVNIVDARDAEREIPAANFPNIRFCNVPQTWSKTPLDDVPAAWIRCAPEVASQISAVAYYFGRQLHQDLNVPIGLIASWCGGSEAERWISMPRFLELDDLSAVQAYKQSDANHDAVMRAYERSMAEWKKNYDAAPGAERSALNPPPAPPSADAPTLPTVLFNGMVHPIIPFTIRGVIWYQGESNAVRARGYRALLPALVADWRQRWALGDFPFLIVQLANCNPLAEKPGDSNWAELREAQMLAARTLPNVYTISAIDIGDAVDIHPRNKQDVGKRLALAAEAKAYDMDIVWSGPTMRSLTIEGGKARITFDYVAGGLRTKPEGEPVKGFAIAGEDQKFVWAEATIDGGDAMIVGSDAVPNPVAIRYLWADNPQCNLYNTAGLPASPFRTDDWPGITSK